MKSFSRAGGASTGHHGNAVRLVLTAFLISGAGFYTDVPFGCIQGGAAEYAVTHLFPIRYRPSPNVTRFQSTTFQTVELAVVGSVLVTSRMTTRQRILFTTARAVLAITRDQAVGTLERLIKKCHKTVVDVRKLTCLENKASTDVDPREFGFLLM
jgi:hypothetical protein